MRVLKPHGSCNFLPHIPEELSIEGGIFSGKEADIETNGIDALTLSTEDVESWFRQHPEFPPIMSAYVAGKRTKTNPSIVKWQRNQWSEALGKAKQVFVCGVQVNAQDEHIWEPLAKTGAQIIYVDIDTTKFEQWAAKNGRPHDRAIRQDFAKHVHQLAGKITRR